MANKIEGTLKFSEQEGKFCIVDEAEQIFLCQLEFGDEFEVFDGSSWVNSSLQIDSGAEGELVFALKGTSFKGVLDGVKVRAISKN